jgi:alpha-L-rhamnosidase
MKTMRNFLVILLLLSCGSLFGEVQVQRLRCEGLENPLGIDAVPPRLSWIMTSEVNGDKQTAYQILAADGTEQLAQNHGSIWDSGKVQSSDSLYIPYQGKTLQPGQKVFWKVRIWDKDGKASAWSQTAFWSAGLFQKADWLNARWIAFKDDALYQTEWRQHYESEKKRFDNDGYYWETGQDDDIFKLYNDAEPKYDAAPLLRKEFFVTKNIKSATLYITGLGVYESFLNGSRVGRNVLAPAATNYHIRVLYDVYDVKSMLKDGRNAFGITLGRGNHSRLVNEGAIKRFAPWTGQPKAVALLKIEYDDGQSEAVITDSTWKVSGGPVLYDDDQHGELYDARCEQAGWNTSGFDDSRWKNAAEVEWNVRFESQKMPPCRCFDAVQPVRTVTKKDGTVIYDFGKNLSGWVRLTVKGSAGQKVLIDYAETPADKELIPNLSPKRFIFKTNNPQYAPFYDNGVVIRQQSGYILKDSDLPQTFECSFTYKAFQFVRITADKDVKIEKIESVPVYTNLPSAGAFRCSNETVNKIQSAAVNGILSNTHGYITDDPHRDKNGWTEDNLLVAASVFYNFDAAPLYAKWLQDLAETQVPSGEICFKAPCSQHVCTCPCWGEAMVMIPLEMYQFTGDKSVLAKYADTMRRVAQSNMSRQVKDKAEIIAGALGDWMSPIIPLSDTKRNNNMTPPEGSLLYGTASHYRNMKNLAEIHTVLADKSGADKYAAWAERIAERFNAEFYDKAKGIYHGERPTEYRQAANAVPLQYGLVPKDEQTLVRQHLIEAVHQFGDRLSAGFLGTAALLDYLGEHDPELAYKMVTQPEYPGWGYMIANGATTMWEGWDGDDSRNHSPYCLVSGYFYRNLAGIQIDPASPAFRHFVLKPAFIKELTFLEAFHESPYGRIGVVWRREGTKIILHVQIPANTTATLVLPSGSRELPSGKYEFEQ